MQLQYFMATITYTLREIHMYASFGCQTTYRLYTEIHVHESATAAQ